MPCFQIVDYFNYGSVFLSKIQNFFYNIYLLVLTFYQVKKEYVDKNRKVAVIGSIHFFF